MSETKHTPGEWTACEPWQDTYNKHVPIKIQSAPAITIAETIGPRNGIHCEADARLIAAAPDLLAALQAVAAIKPTNEAGTYDMGMALAEIHRVASAAIRKATGEV